MAYLIYQEFVITKQDLKRIVVGVSLLSIIDGSVRSKSIHIDNCLVEDVSKSDVAKLVCEIEHPKNSGRPRVLYRHDRLAIDRPGSSENDPFPCSGSTCTPCSQAHSVSDAIVMRPSASIAALRTLLGSGSIRNSD